MSARYNNSTPTLFNLKPAKLSPPTLPSPFEGEGLGWADEKWDFLYYRVKGSRVLLERLFF